MDHFFSLNSGALFIADNGAFYIADDTQATGMVYLISTRSFMNLVDAMLS